MASRPTPILFRRPSAARPREARTPRQRPNRWCVLVSESSNGPDRLYARHASEAAARAAARRLNAVSPPWELYYVLNYAAESGKAYQ